MPWKTWSKMSLKTDLCSFSGRPHNPQQRDNGRHPLFRRLISDLIKKKDLLDRLEDDDDIKWKPNPFGVEYINEEDKTPEELMSKIAWF